MNEDKISSRSSLLERVNRKGKGERLYRENAMMKRTEEKRAIGCGEMEKIKPRGRDRTTPPDAETGTVCIL